ncbi:MAG: tRNA (adenosine(37)-N6)-threonylcarbamoyltransferase complex transferase subunit TsaD [Candidatus Andersenbacteria bacterium]
MPQTTLLALETSCDETGVALLRRTGDDRITVLAEALASQTNIHALTGGVIPEVAAREHVSVLPPLLKQVFTAANITGQDLDAIAVTIGPGLQPALAVGVNAARALAYAWHKPLIPVHHLEGHIYSALLMGEVLFPALALIVSGGHTQLIAMRHHLDYEVMGTTRDDAAGEAFDKVARLLGLPYPGGPALANLARQGDAAAFAFPRPMLTAPHLDFSFSGLKTAVLYAWRAIPAVAQESAKADIAASFQQAVVDTLVGKTKQALVQMPPCVLLLAGGVAANHLLRERLEATAAESGIPLRIAPQALCGDNAVMIGQAGFFAYEGGRRTTESAIDAQARVDIAQ